VSRADDQRAALAAVLDPATPTGTLHALVADWPDLAPIAAEHPNADAALRARPTTTDPPPDEPAAPAPPPHRRRHWPVWSGLVATAVVLAVAIWWLTGWAGRPPGLIASPTPSVPATPSTPPLGPVPPPTPGRSTEPASAEPTTSLTPGTWTQIESANTSTPGAISDVTWVPPHWLVATNDTDAMTDWLDMDAARPSLGGCGVVAQPGATWIVAPQPVPPDGSPDAAQVALAYGVTGAPGTSVTWSLLIATVRHDPAARTQPPMSCNLLPDLQLTGGLHQMVWAGSTLIVVDDASATAVGDWSVPLGGVTPSWIGTEAFTTATGVVSTKDGRPAGYGTDLAGWSTRHTSTLTYEGPAGAPLRVESDGGDVSILAWDPGTDTPRWAKPLSFHGSFGWYTDPAAGDVLLVLEGRAVSGNGRDVTAPTSLTAYSIATGARLWQAGGETSQQATCSLGGPSSPTDPPGPVTLAGTTVLLWCQGDPTLGGVLLDATSPLPFTRVAGAMVGATADGRIYVLPPTDGIDVYDGANLAAGAVRWPTTPTDLVGAEGGFIRSRVAGRWLCAWGTPGVYVLG